MIHYYDQGVTEHFVNCQSHNNLLLGLNNFVCFDTYFIFFIWIPCTTEYTEYGVRATVCARSRKLSNVAPGSKLDG